MNMFKKVSAPFVAVAETLETDAQRIEKSNKLVDEIHAEFDNEVYKLLADAGLTIQAESLKKPQFDKANRLSALGFASSKTVVSVQKDQRALDKAKELKESIEHFTNKYPNNKFITPDSVAKICKKYGLVLGGVDIFLGDVPEDNIKDIENFNVKDEDRAYEYAWDGFMSFRSTRSKNFYTCDKEYADQIMKSSDVSVRESMLMIAGPAKDFDLRGKEIKDNVIMDIPVKDPVVLQPVYHNNELGYLIITAWGKEASDELVVNDKFN